LVSVFAGNTEPVDGRLA